MKTSIRVFIILLITILLFGCAPKEPEIPLEQSALLQFTTAYDTIRNAGTYHLTATVEKEVIVGSEVFTETRTQKISCANFNSESAILSAKETIKNGELEYVQSKYHKDGIAYLLMEEGNFSSVCSLDDFAAGLAPVFLIDTSLYQTITAQKDGETILLTFSEPIQEETWASNSGKFVTATGYATLSETGEIWEMRYEHTAEADGAEIITKVTVVPQDTTPVDNAPPSKSNCMRISSIQSPEILESACAYLQQAVNMDSDTKSETVSDAFGLKRTQETKLSMRGKGDAFHAEVTTQVTQTDASRDSKTSVMKQTEKFSDRKYTVTVDKEKPSTVEGVTEETMRNYCQDILLGNILLPQYLNEANLSKTDKTTVTFNATQDMSDIICTNISQTLYNDPTFLESVSNNIESKSMKCYITVHNATGLPLSAGMHYEGTHNIDSATYEISYKFDQTYTAVNVPAENTAK